MSAVRHFISDRRRAPLLVALMLAVAGCSSGGEAVLEGPVAQNGLRLQTVETAPEVVQPRPELRQAQAPSAVEIKPAAAQEPAPETSAWCTYLKEDSAAEATVLRSPTLSGSVTDQGKSQLSLGLSATSFAKAQLVEQAASIKCRRYLAEQGLQKLAFVSPQGLTAAGFRAKSKSINARKGELAELRRLIAKQLNDGNITAEKATTLSVMIDQIVADGNAARSQADRRMTDSFGASKDADVLSEELIKAERDLDALNSRMRTVDATDLSLSAGWNDTKLFDGADVNRDSFSGKVSFSVKLGALAPQRYEHERRASEAKVAAIRDQEGGALWQIQMLRKAHERALDGLSESRNKLNDALSEATRLVSVLSSVENPEFLPTLIGAKIQVVRLQAEKAAVDGSIQEIGENIKRLKLG
jgi:hypothetical protein